MSKEKPEVGDVWKLKTKIKVYKILILNEYEDSYDVLVTEQNRIWKTELITIDSNFTYLGKSKVNIKELFEVEKENKEKDKLATDLKQIVRDSAKQVREIIDDWNKGVV